MATATRRVPGLKNPINFIKYLIDRIYVKFYLYLARKQGAKRKAVIKTVRQLVLDFYDIGRRSKYIPKEIKTRAQLRQHILFFHGDALAAQGLRLDVKLKIKVL